MDIGGLIHLVVFLVILGLLFWVLWWFVNFVGLPEPFNKVAKVIIALVAVLIVVYLLLGMVGTPPALHLRQ